MWQYLRRKWQSLIFRLLFYFILSMLALALVLAGSFTNRIKPHLRNEVLPNLNKYVGYLIEDIGVPPDLGVAQQLADSLPFEIRIEGPDINWASTPALNSISSLESIANNNAYDRGHRRQGYLLIDKPPYRFLFAQDESFQDRDRKHHWVLFLLLGSILFLLYLGIRRMFRPIELISQQLEKIGGGELDQPIVTSGKGELALLADGINQMAKQIKSMLDGKSGLLLAISHELRSPITRMRVNLELLEESQTRQKLIEDIHEMEALLAAILESEKLNSRHAPLSRSQCDLKSLIETLVSQHPGAARISAHLDGVNACVDPLRIRLLLKNLIDNAYQYSAQEPIEISLQQIEKRVHIRVRDQGEGIAAEELPRLTEAFYRPDSARQRNTGGYGLGLYLCRLIVEAHRGEMRIESQVGVGTSVLVDLPSDNS